MSRVDGRALAAMLAEVAAAMTANKGQLCELDGVIGDADHGIAMELGFMAARDAAADAAEAAPSDVLTVAGKAFLNAVGASSGPLYATGFLEAAKRAKGLDALDDAATLALFEDFAAGIARRGKAGRGAKSMLDAWGPAADAAQAAREAGEPFEAAAPAVVAAAQAGAESTAEMVAQLGRAARLGERSRGHRDPGAVSAALVIATMVASLGASQGPATA